MLNFTVELKVGKPEEINAEEFHKTQKIAFEKNSIIAARLLNQVTQTNQFAAAIAYGIRKDGYKNGIDRYIRQILGIIPPETKYAAALYRLLAGDGEFDEPLKKISTLRNQKYEKIVEIQVEIDKVFKREICTVYFILKRCKF